jgi:hypothetical protein
MVTQVRSQVMLELASGSGCTNRLADGVADAGMLAYSGEKQMFR